MFKLKKNFFIARYFIKTKKIIKNNNDKVTLQFFQRKNNTILCGIKQVLEILKKNTPIKKYQIKHLNDGDVVNELDIVLELEGNYKYFGEYEGVIDGILARMSSVATNAHLVKKAVGSKGIIAMADRADLYVTQT
jgi:nicotinate phosphoribosyltransferase